MACKACVSERQQDFSGELAVVFPGVQRINLSPVYVARKSWSAWTAGIPNLFFPQPDYKDLRTVWRNSIETVRNLP